MVLATKNTKSAFFSAFSAISAVKNNAAEVFVFNRKERKDRKELSSSCFGQDYRIYKIGFSGIILKIMFILSKLFQPCPQVQPESEVSA